MNTLTRDKFWRLKTDRGKATIIAAYAPEKGKTDESVDFYDTLQKVLDRFNKSDQIILMGDLNARVGNVPIPNSRVFWRGHA